ncbi:branched-chain amino acid transport system II carrier protein [Escherichia coli]
MAAAVASCGVNHRLPGNGSWWTCACAEFFAQYVPLSYRTLVFILGGFSMVVSNLGLSQLIQISVPAPTHPSAVYRTGCMKFYTLTA